LLGKNGKNHFSSHPPQAWLNIFSTRDIYFFDMSTRDILNTSQGDLPEIRKSSIQIGTLRYKFSLFDGCVDNNSIYR
jgi:hypothetical protein